MYDKDNSAPIQTVSADHSVAYYENGYMQGVKDRDGGILIQYTYDENQDLISTEFIAVRDALEREYEKASEDILAKKGKAIEELAGLERDKKAYIENEVKIIQTQIGYERTRLQQQRSKYDENV